VRHHHPVGLIAPDLLPELAHAASARLLQLADERGGRVFQLIRIVREDRQDRVAGVDVLHERGRQPRRELGERLAWGVLKAHQMHRLVAPDRFNERRAGTIGAGGDRAHERRRLE